MRTAARGIAIPNPILAPLLKPPLWVSVLSSSAAAVSLALGALVPVVVGGVDFVSFTEVNFQMYASAGGGRVLLIFKMAVVWYQYR